MTQMLGKQSIRFETPPYIEASGSVVGKKEGEGPLGDLFDMVSEDDTFGCDCWEEAESTLQKEAAALTMGKAGVKPEDVRYIFAGDLLGQTIATSFGIVNYEIPLFGLYGACSTAGESMSLGAMCVAGGYANRVLAMTSSHFASAEKQFRFPLEYGNQRPVSATWTVTGSGAFLLGTEKSHVKISGITTGKIMDYGVRDSMNMGAAMAPAACDLIVQHFEDFQTSPKDYDRIITGDLGYVGQEILLTLTKERGYDISAVHTDCGIEIFDKDTQGTDSGGSGCGCSAVTMSAFFLPQIQRGELKKVLFVPTGALLSKISFNEGQTVPGIAHGVVLEYEA
ncbi:MAG: stage V sporulation protein AD [Lachnospiraceae bacterium]|nr:stage V sporulation protein AD [Lachnospiraceae bacterium]